MAKSSPDLNPTDCVRKSTNIPEFKLLSKEECAETAVR